MYPHGVDPLQFTGPVLRFVFWDIFTVWMVEKKSASEEGKGEEWSKYRHIRGLGGGMEGGGGARRK